MPRCPVCDVPVSLEATPTAPFCSDRCRLIDLGRWLEEAYGVPRPAVAPDEEEAEHEGRGADPTAAFDEHD